VRAFGPQDSAAQDFISRAQLRWRRARWRRTSVLRSIAMKHGGLQPLR